MFLPKIPISSSGSATSFPLLLHLTTSNGSYNRIKGFPSQCVLVSPTLTLLSNLHSHSSKLLWGNKYYLNITPLSLYKAGYYLKTDGNITVKYPITGLENIPGRYLRSLNQSLPRSHNIKSHITENYVQNRIRRNVKYLEAKRVMEQCRMNKTVLTSSTILCLITTAFLMGLVFAIQPVKASGTIYVRADGSVVPNTAPIASVDNVTYTLIGNIYDEIVVERDNIVVDGKGYTIQGTGNGTGMYLSDRSNVTVKNMEIRAFQRGVRLDDSSNNTISGNNVTHNEYGIVLYGSSSSNTLRHNDASDNRYNLGIHTASVSGYIQDIDDSNTVNGKPVYYWVNRRDMTVPLDAGYVVLVNCTRITVKNLSLTNNMQGVVLAFTTNSIITENNLINNFDGIRLDHSSNNNTISGNNITANTWYGIRFYYDPSTNAMSMNNVANTEYGSQLGGPPCNNTVSGNNITNNEDGIRLDYSSNNTISANNVASNGYGIGLYHSSGGNAIFGNNITGNENYGIWLRYSHSTNTISGNNIVNNWVGIWLFYSYSNWFYRNNFIDNARQVYSTGYGNTWDAGYPSGGNYWSDYDGTDIYSGLHQNETGSDGIADALYDVFNIWLCGQDNYPLLGMFHDFNATSECHVQTICNSIISDFQFNGTAIDFNVTGENDTTGFCRICIPTVLMNGTFRVFMNGTEILLPPEPLPCSNSTYNYIYLAYSHSTQEITIIPELPSLIILPLFMVMTLLATIVCRIRKAKIKP